jgi:hypothetical protein
VAQICFLVADKLSQKVILALEIVRLLVLMKIRKEINTIVWFSSALPSCMEWAPSQTSPSFNT